MDSDIIVYDRDDEPLLLLNVEVSVDDLAKLQEFLGRFISTEPRIPFGMYVDLESILLFGGDIQDPNSPLVKLDTQTTLSRYDPDFKGKKSAVVTKLVFRDYLATLIDVWLKDFAFHWESKYPPGAEELAGTGFVQRIAGGMIRSDVTLHVAPLS